MQNNTGLVLGVLGVLVLLAVIFAFVGSRPGASPGPIDDVTTACVQHGRLGMHIHPHLTLIIDSEERTISADVGIVSDICFRPIHTHDDSGTLHLEFPVEQEVRLKEFFRVWGVPFSRQQILDRTITEADVMRVTVNGEETNALEDLVLRDGDRVVVEVARRGQGHDPSPSPTPQ